jgi:hypothetical protein
MSQSERRHERLAVRLSLIISRLVAGETLIIQTLAAEFGVSVRTLRRDFRERLAYLDLEFRNGQCRLLSGSRQRELTVQTFVRQSGVEALFPDIDNQLVNSLLSASESPCLIWHSTNVRTQARPEVFTRLSRHHRTPSGNATGRGSSLHWSGSLSTGVQRRLLVPDR